VRGFLGFLLGTIINTTIVYVLDRVNGSPYPRGLVQQADYPTGSWKLLLIVMAVVYVLCLYGMYTAAWVFRKLGRRSSGPPQVRVTSPEGTPVPVWICPWCQAVNVAARQSCGNCGRVYSGNFPGGE
jgi:hypothetical protein